MTMRYWPWPNVYANECPGYGAALRLRDGVAEKVRMNQFSSQPAKSGPNRAFFGVAIISFLVGAAVVAYFFERAQSPSANEQEEIAALAQPQTGEAADPKPSPSPSETSKEAAAAVERVAEQQGGIDQRLAAAEQRLARLDLQSQAAAGNAARAEGLLIAFATRRALERGAELGYLADQLRLRFGDALPNAVRTVISASRKPVTLDQLIARLDGLAPELSNPEQGPSFSKIWNELGSLFVIRRDSTPSPQPEKRLERARLFLQTGRVDMAIEEVKFLPGAAKAQGWVDDAERYSAVQRALELIETAAVVEPRLLRDGSGKSIEQPGPANEAN